MRYTITLLVICSGVIMTHALYISEIMYDPQGSDAGREWVEIYNDTSNDIDLTAWKFNESNTNHGITSFAGSGKLNSNSYAVIADNPAKFLIDFPSYTGVLYDSSFSLSNTGEPLAVKDNTGAIIDSVTYNPTLGGNDDGTTLSLINSLWVKGNGTPGSVNEISSNTSTSTTIAPITPNATTTDNQGTIKQTSPPSSDIMIYMAPEKVVVAGALSTFSVAAMTRAGRNIDNPNVTWAFGDGGQANGTTTEYAYAYPGRYIAQAEVGNGLILGIGRMIVTVIPPDISIVNTGSGKYGSYIDVINPNRYDLDFSQWKLSVGGAIYPFPKNTLIPGGATTRISGLALGFASTTIWSSTEVRILFPTLEEVTRYIPKVPEQIVLGVATTTMPVFQEIKKPALSKTVTKAKKASVKVSKVKSATMATSTKVVDSSTNTVSSIPMAASTSKSQKDTRLVSWIKGLF
ncbi:MAG: Lamin globular tail-like protein [Candidatus Nomurabacteria bacterium]|nr:Lamin globular tail-like protein [Candidatus Nomurabacteria bacterium]